MTFHGWFHYLTILLTSKELCIKVVVLGAKRKKGVFQMNDPSFHLFEMQVCFKGWGVVGKIASPPSTVLCIKCACLLYIWPLITNKKNVCKIKCSRLTGHKSIHCAISSISNMDPIQISICLRPLTNWPAAQGRDPWPRSIVFCLSTTGLHDCGKEMGGGGVFST